MAKRKGVKKSDTSKEQQLKPLMSGLGYRWWFQRHFHSKATPGSWGTTNALTWSIRHYSLSFGANVVLTKHIKCLLNFISVYEYLLTKLVTWLFLIAYREVWYSLLHHLLLIAVIASRKIWNIIKFCLFDWSKVCLNFKYPPLSLHKHAFETLKN